MKLTLAVIVYWLSVNFDLPRIEHASADKMLELRYQGPATPRAAKAGSLGAYRSVVALYDSSTKTIYLSKKWSSQTPSEMFILVPETSEKLDAFELRVLRFARETVRYQTRRLQNWPEALPPVSSGKCCLRSSGWSRTRMASRA